MHSTVMIKPFALFLTDYKIDEHRCRIEIFLVGLETEGWVDCWMEPLPIK